MIKTVYVVIGDDTEVTGGDETIGDKWIVGVFTNKSMAERAIDEDRKSYPKTGRHYGDLGYHIESMILDTHYHLQFV